MKFLSRQSRRTVSPKPRTARPRLEPLDSRLFLSGFGSADGAYIVEPWVGGYSAVGTPANNTLTAGAVKPLVNEAIAIWQARGADTSRLGHVDLVITNPPVATLDIASGDTITLGSNAAGWGWVVGRSSRRGRVPQAGRMDLLSALTTRAV